MEKNAFVALLITVVRGLAAKWPNAKYTKCDGLYLYDKGKVENGPEFEGCIFGQAFRIIGPMLPPDFAQHNWPSDYCGKPDVKAIRKLLNDYYELDESVKNYVYWCNDVQAYQDTGLTWSNSIALADNDHLVNV